METVSSILTSGTITKQALRARARIAMARERLGGRCVDCKSTERLEFHHIDPKNKKGNISVIANWSLKRFLEEVDKCQLLCKLCHTEETRRTANGHGQGKLGKNKCKCDLCLPLKRKHSRNYMQIYRMPVGF